MPRGPTSSDDWERDLFARLTHFAREWGSFSGTEQAGAQMFLNSLLDIYAVDFSPGKIFEQHPVRLPSVTAQASLFAGEHAPRAYTTERMDMYLPKVCVWEMKSPTEKHLGKHHAQLLGYWSRVRPRYMVLCNFREFWIYDTNDEYGQNEPKLRFSIAELPARGDALLFLRGDVPDLAARAERVTAEIAQVLGRLARTLIAGTQGTPRDRERVARLILECVFAMFAEDTELVPPKMFEQAMKRAHESGEMDAVWTLFDDFGRERPDDKSNRYVPYVNGPLFDHGSPKLSLTRDQIHDLYSAAKDFQWQDVRPEIFGSIFEQALDLTKRHELGAHFTREQDILRVVGPTVIEPWRARIHNLRTSREAEALIEELKAFHVLDPACGCGNFLYVVYREMKRLEAALAALWDPLERKVAKRKADIRPCPPGPWFTVRQLHGIEKNGFGALLARVVLWIGEHLAKRELGLDEETLPLKNLDAQVREGDALFVDWPRPEGELAIVGNPPYLGVRKLRHELGDEYVEKLFARFPDNRAADYVTYWFPRALEVLREGERAGYVCTNSIAQNDSREASIDKVIAKGGTITDAWHSYPWPGEAKVHVSVVNWVMTQYDGIKKIDGQEVASISPALTQAVDVTAARHILQNEGLCFMGVTPGNDGFVLSDEQRGEILANDPASEVVIRRFLVGRDVNREIDQLPTRWIVDFAAMTREEAGVFGGALRYAQRSVYAAKSSETARKTDAEKDRWWQFVRPRAELREAITGLKRVLVVPRVSPHLIISRQDARICFDGQLMVLPLPERYHFGLLQSRLHAIWAWARGSTLKGDLRYTNTTIFETFPFPLLPDGKYDPRVRPRTEAADRVAAAAEEFDRLRSAACRARNLGLTKIHNDLEAGQPPELRAAYDALNDAVTACYGFPEGIWRDERETLRLLLARNHAIADAG